MSYFKVAVLLACITGSFALFRNNAYPTATAEGRAIDEKCLALADKGSCEFYICFEQRLPCGRDWYMLRTGNYYCNKMNRERDNFSPAGQQFLDKASQCLARALKDYYKRDYIDCHKLEHAAVDTVTPCFTELPENSFCDVYYADSSNFHNIFEASGLFSPGASKFWRVFLSLTMKCGLKAIPDFPRDTINSLYNSVWDSMGKK